MKTKLCELDEFLRGYLEAAFFTSDEDAGSGEYETSGRPEIMMEKLSAEALQSARIDCARFTVSCAHQLSKVGTPIQNGHDFWFTREGHGVGFWDRGYPEEVGDFLTTESEKFGNVDLYLGDDGQLYFSK